MVKILKKLTAFVVALMVLTTCVPVAFAGVDYSIEDAYDECAAMYPDFVDQVLAQGATEKQIITFLESVQEYLLNLDVEITEDNFEEYLIEGINAAIALRKNIKVRDALIAAFPEAVVDGVDGKINEDFEPIVETIKLIIFEHGLLDDGVEEETEEIKPSEEETEPSVETPTEEVTEPTTEPSTEPATEPGKESSGNTPSFGNDDADDVVTETETTPAVQFSDMEQAAWAKDAVYSLVNMGVINGYPDGTFKPNNSITRAEFAKIIVIASGRYDAKEAYVSNFTDVLTSDWHYPYVSAAYKFQFITGRSAEIFDPNSNITRADLCLIVYRYIKSINPEFKAKTETDGSVATFADALNVPSYAVEAVGVLYTNGIAPVRDAVNNKFEPTAYATRAECAYIVHKAIKAALGLNK